MPAIGKALWRLGLLVGVSAAVFAIAGVGATKALAWPPTCPGGSFTSYGDTVQSRAQAIWDPGYHSACTPGVNSSLSYNASGSGTALTLFRFIGSGTTIDYEIPFIGTDVPPNASQIAHAEAVTSSTPPLIIPVTQTAIAVMAHPPTGCTLTRITSKDLNAVFGGNGIKHWSEFATASGTCSSAVTRVVREEPSGVTLQFKNYLAQVVALAGGSNPPCMVGSATEWSQLEEIHAGAGPNIEWPQCTGGTSIVREAGSNALAAEVAGTAGTIGYAPLPDAEANGATAVSLQNGTSGGSPTYGAPVSATLAKTANCSATKYKVPPGALPEKEKEETEGLAVDWSGVFGGFPTIGGEAYPLCMLAYDIAWSSYGGAGYGITISPTATAAITKDYLHNYVVATAAGGGQVALQGHYYAGLPSSVQSAAEFASGLIGP